MRWFILLPGMLGLAAVIQGGLNRQISGQWGLSNAAFFNTLVLLAATAGLLVYTVTRPESLPEFFRVKGGLGASWASFRWWYLIPGLCGMSLVVGIPYAIQRIGAFPVFLGILGGQLVASLLWDAAVEHRPVTLVRLAGAGLALLAAWMVGRQA